MGGMFLLSHVYQKALSNPCGARDCGDFEPDKNVTRTEIAVVMAKLLNLDYKYYETTCPFSDMPDCCDPRLPGAGLRLRKGGRGP